MERSEDHYWRYFYVRGLILSCIHSFREAINDLTLAVALSGVARPECYLLRSKCLQIEGQGNEAFKDLQEYICKSFYNIASSQTRWSLSSQVCWTTALLKRSLRRCPSSIFTSTNSPFNWKLRCIFDSRQKYVFVGKVQRGIWYHQAGSKLEILLGGGIRPGSNWYPRDY